MYVRDTLMSVAFRVPPSTDQVDKCPRLLRGRAMPVWQPSPDLSPVEHELMGQLLVCVVRLETVYSESSVLNIVCNRCVCSVNKVL